MELDRELKDRIMDNMRSYLEDNNIPYRSITIRDGKPIVIVSNDILYRLMDTGLDDKRINGRFIAQGENGWAAYVSTDGAISYNFAENLTEYQASRFALGIDYGRKPKLSRYARAII